MNNKIFSAARRFVSPIVLTIIVAITALVVTFSSANSVVHAGDAAGGNIVVRFPILPHHVR